MNAMATERRKRMSESRADVLVLFGATGDLARKKLFPAAGLHTGARGLVMVIA